MEYFKHLKDVEMTFYAHFKLSISYYMLLQRGALRALLHSVWPDVYTTTMSDTIGVIKEKMEKTI